MCDSGKLTEQLFTSIPFLKKWQRVFVVVTVNAAKEIEIESILYCEASDTPQGALEDFCKAAGLDPASRLCLPVVLPAGLRQEDAKGFKAIRDGINLHVEFTQ